MGISYGHARGTARVHGERSEYFWARRSKNMSGGHKVCTMRIDEENLRRIREILEDISEFDDDSVIIVEGRKDRNALRELGISGNIFVLNTGRSIVENSEELMKRYTHACILTDWDRKGGELARALRNQLSSLGMEFSLAERREIASLCRADIKDVESLSGYLTKAESFRHQDGAFEWLLSGFPQ